MDFTEKAKVRLEHWLEHNDEHLQQYEAFARELKAGGKTECAEKILEAAELTARGSESLRRAIEALK